MSAILQLCEQLSSRSDVSDAFDPHSDSESVQLVALGLERRWHAIWLQSLEWQCRLEEAHTRDKVRTLYMYNCVRLSCTGLKVGPE